MVGSKKETFCSSAWSVSAGEGCREWRRKTSKLRTRRICKLWEVNNWNNIPMQFRSSKLTDWPNIQEEMAVMPSVFGDTLVTLLKMLIRTRKRVTSKAIRPGTTWCGGFKKQYIAQLDLACAGLCRNIEVLVTRRRNQSRSLTNQGHLLNHLGWYEKADPGSDDEECGREVVDVPGL